MSLKPNKCNGVITDDRHFRRVGLVIVLSILAPGAWSALAPAQQCSLGAWSNYRRKLPQNRATLEGGYC